MGSASTAAGGYGDALKREADRVLDHVLDGKVSPAAAAARAYNQPRRLK